VSSARKKAARKPGRPLSDERVTGAVYEKRALHEIAARWDARAATWDSSLQEPDCHLNEDEAYSRFLDEVHAVLKQRRQFCATGGVIDVGCGTGLVLADVVSWFAWGIGVDISSKMIQVARRKRIPHARFLVADAFELSRNCPAAAAILSRGVLLSHYGHKQGSALLKALRAALVPKGVLILDFLNRAARGRHCHGPETKAYFEGDEVCEMARQAGFCSAKIAGGVERRVLLLIAEVND
jgi:SAM-dependent methyltransferase